MLLLVLPILLVAIVEVFCLVPVDTLCSRGVGQAGSMKGF